MNVRRQMGLHADPPPRSATDRLELAKAKRDSLISAVSGPIVLAPADLYFDYSEYLKINSLKNKEKR